MTALLWLVIAAYLLIRHFGATQNRRLAAALIDADGDPEQIAAHLDAADDPRAPEYLELAIEDSRGVELARWRLDDARILVSLPIGLLPAALEPEAADLDDEGDEES